MLHKKADRGRAAWKRAMADVDNWGTAACWAMIRACELQVEALSEEAQQEPPTAVGREVAETAHVGGVTYRLEHVRCGKRGCHCVDGRGHGPYWYSYRWEAGRCVSRYVGLLDPRKQG